MKITLLKLEYRNFLSYGNITTEILFGRSGIVSITGTNGAGKSVFEDALAYVLYGKPYRNIKLKEIMNRTNKKSKTWIRLHFKRNSEQYRITRTMMKSKSTIVIEHLIKGKWTEVELLSTVSLIQDEINRLIGVKFETFRSIVAIASTTAQTKPFLAMKAAEKRSLIENLFNLESIAQMSKVVKKDKSELKVKLNVNENTIDIYDGDINHLKTQYKSTNNAIKVFDKSKQDFIDKYNSDIDELIKEQGALTKEVKELGATVSPEQYKELQDRLKTAQESTTECNKQIGSCDALIKYAKDTSDTLKASDKCPICATDITEEHATKELDKLQSIIKSQEDEKQRLINIIEINDATIKECNVEISIITQTLNNIASIETKINNIATTISNNKQLVEDKRNETLSDLNIEALKTRMDKVSSDLKTAKKSKKELEYKQKVIEMAEFLLSDKGIKTEFYNVVVPLFNKTVNEYITKFGLSIAVIFDNHFDYSIQTMTDVDVNYFSFSQGERSRIDISILLTFIKMSKTIANWDCNLLLLDEVIDQNLDTEGLLLMLESIKTIAQEESLTAMVISHKLSEANFNFDREIVVKKKGGFSEMTEL